MQYDSRLMEIIIFASFQLDNYENSGAVTFAFGLYRTNIIFSPGLVFSITVDMLHYCAVLSHILAL